jgi:hypothetical protein
MQKYLLGAAAAAFMMAGASSAMANEACGPLPNDKWSWTTVHQSGGDPTTELSFGDINYQGGSGNGFADVTTTTTTPGGTLTCIALNPAGKEVPGQSTTVELPPVVTTSEPVNMQVCVQSPNGVDLAGDLCR